jgi:hypothetical protein
VLRADEPAHDGRRAAGALDLLEVDVAGACEGAPG